MSTNGKMKRTSWAEIDLKAVKYNFQQIKHLAKHNKFSIPGRPKPKHPPMILAVVKADAYGHGMEKISKLLVKEGVDYFAVSNVEEGIQLRDAKIKKPILLFESTFPNQAKQICDYRLTPTVCTIELANALNRYAKKNNKCVRIHINVDTGMGRLGIWHTQAFDFIQKVHKLDNLILEGIYTHFPSADTDKKFTKEQLGKLYQLVVKLDKAGLIIPFIHAANSSGLIGYKTHILNIFRPGLMLYGLYPHASLKKKIRLKPVMSVRSRIIFLKEIEKGRSISYGRTFIAKKKMKVATIPIGYKDGYLRTLSNKASVIVDGKKCPVLGRVTMDQIVVDVSKTRDVKLGQTAMVLGKVNGNEVSANELANYANTINYEVICNLGNNLGKKYKD